MEQPPEHFCCDRYDDTSSKAYLHQRRCKSQHLNEFTVQEQVIVTDAKVFFAVSTNKMKLLQFLCDSWCTSEQLSTFERKSLYISGGFHDETTILVTAAVLPLSLI